ncbi:MAG: nucleotidyltransferase domain-containing protein [Nanoarchaeota archaeon]|nr:nucleotidyltransferase domain-containing protein [Nanoarchaeota archaeon]
MLQKNNKYKILRIFFEDPIPIGIGFQLREISRRINLAPTSVKNYLKELEKENLIVKKKHRIHNYPIYYANRNNPDFKDFKKINTLLMLKEINLIEHLNDTCMPEAIILFGSASKGEDILGSDIDIFVMSKKQKLDLQKYETKLKRKINIFFSDNFNKLSKELKNNIINGIILKGYLKIF